MRVQDWAKVLQLYHEMTFALVYKDSLKSHLYKLEVSHLERVTIVDTIAPATVSK